MEVNQQRGCQRKSFLCYSCKLIIHKILMHIIEQENFVHLHEKICQNFAQKNQNLAKIQIRNGGQSTKRLSQSFLSYMIQTGVFLRKAVFYQGGKDEGELTSTKIQNKALQNFLPFAWLLFGTVKIPSKTRISKGTPRAWPMTGQGHTPALGCKSQSKKRPNIDHKNWVV